VHSEYATSWMIWGLIPSRERDFVFTKKPKHALGPTLSPIQLKLEALSFGVKCLGCKVKHSSPSRATLYLHSPLYAFTVRTGTALRVLTVTVCDSHVRTGTALRVLTVTV